MIALSPWWRSQNMNTTTRATKPTSSLITSPLPYGAVIPPYCKASINATIAPITKATPGKSICNSFSFHVASTGRAVFGVWKNTRMISAASPPTGRLI